MRESNGEIGIFEFEELKEKSTCSITEQIASDGKLRKMKLYNLVAHNLTPET